MPSKSFGSVRIFYPPFRRDEVLALLRQRLARLREKLPLKQVVLFGSYAKGRHTVASDIDLLVVYEGEPREDAYALVKRTLGIRRLEPHVYAEEEYEQLKPTIARMIRDGIPLLEGAEGATDP
ncbi:MAG: nucleotidyltransferase domain-containing protein [Chloroflexi bacterium]|nr:MAG: nucleotidyltransferase domain-containing protein [Chloroflexota bacterium]